MWSGKIACSLLFLLLLSAPAAAGELTGASRWQGEVVLNETVVIAAGAVLTVAPGTTVHIRKADTRIVVQGVLKVEGSAERPVVFAAPPHWQGIEFVEAPAGSSFAHARFTQAQTAISSLATAFSVRHCTFRECGTAIKLLRESNPVVEDCLFADNEIGLISEMKSVPAIRRNRFTGHRNTALLATHNSRGSIEENLFENNKQAIGLLQTYPDQLVNNRFIKNGTAIFCNQTRNTPLIRGNLFEKNEHALVNFSFAYPAVENNRFLGNGTAIRNDRFASPLISRNLFRQNGTALYNDRKSNPKVEKNRLEENDLALFCDFSSYPEVRQNNFLGNRMGVRLGIHQSADWEKRSGSKAIVQQTAQSRQSQNPLLARAPTQFPDQVDVSGNWWGKETPSLAKGGNNANLAMFHDRHDQPEVTYEGFGPGKYRLDLVVYTPWLDKAVPDAGPEGGK